MLTEVLNEIYIYLYYRCPSRIKQFFFKSHYLPISIPYATHVPVIIGLARLIKVTKVLELGSGLYSTGTYLNKTAFPDLVELYSTENDEGWAKKIGELFSDTRLKYTVIHGDFSEFLDKIDLELFDLIFIDDSSDANSRSQTIDTICKRVPKNSILVIHDFDVPQYRNMSTSIKRRFSYNLMYPNTGVLWNNSAIKFSKLVQLYNLIKENKQKIPLDDVVSWSYLFDSNLENK